MSTSRRVRVLHLIAELGGGGSERWLWDVVRLTAPEKFEHTVVTVYPDYSGNFIYADRLHQSGAYEPTIGKPPGFLRWTIQNLRAQKNRLPARLSQSLSLPLRLGANGLATWRVAKALMRFRPDVVHVHTLPDFILGIFIKIAFNKPLIHTVPCLFSQMTDAGYGWMPKIYARLHPWVDYFSTGEGRTELISIGIPPSKILYDVCGVDLRAFDIAEDERSRHYREVRSQLGLAHDARIALSVGRFHPSKGHIYALESLPTLLQQFDGLHWVVLGEGEEREMLEARVRELGIGEQVHLIGFQNDPLPYYAAADIYLRTTVFEPENLSFYQAMAMGLPVVGFDTGSGPDLINKVGHGILVPNRDAAALGAAASSILASSDTGRAMGKLGSLYSREHLDLQESILILSSAYTELYEKRHGVMQRGDEEVADGSD